MYEYKYFWQSPSASAEANTELVDLLNNDWEPLRETGCGNGIVFLVLRKLKDNSTTSNRMV